MGRYIKNFFLVSCLIGSTTLIGQENDDLYFNKSDRKKEQKELEEMRSKWYASQYPEEESQVAEKEEFKATSFLGKQYEYIPEDELTNGGVDQELIDEYKSGNTVESYTSGTNQDSYYGNDEVASSEFSNQNYSDPIDTYQDAPVVINNYYNDNGWNNWNRWNRPGWNVGIGWNSWGGSFWNVGFGWGGGFYDPFWDPFWGPNWGWNAGWGWNSWAWNGGWGWGGRWGNAWCPPYGGFYNRPVYVVSDYRYRRNIVRSPRTTRGGAVSTSGRSSRRTTAVANERGSSRSYARQQRDYLNQSRSSRYSEGGNARTVGTSSSRATRNSSSVNRGTSSRTSNYGTTSRTNRSSNSNYSRSSSSNSRSSSNYGRSSSSSRSSSYSRPSSGSSRSRSSGSVRSSSSRSSSSGRSSSGRSSSGRSSSRRGN